jgi:hypothetical protein
MTSGKTMSLAPVDDGWAVMLTDGRELARFIGPNAKSEALRYLLSSKPVRPHPSLDEVLRVRGERARRLT